MPITLFELLGFLGALAGLIGGATFGASEYGLLGGVVGAAVGVFAGCFSGVLIVAIPFGIGILWEREVQRFWLRRRFGRYFSRRAKPRWEALKESLQIGQSLSGLVVAEFYYGAILDVELKFPALLGKLWMKDEETVKKGERVEAYVSGFSDFGRVIEVSQRDPEESKCFAELMKAATESKSSETE